MPAWLMSALRTAVQSAWGLLAAWALRRGVDLPVEVPGWVLAVATAGVVGAWTAGVRWLETRRSRVARLLARCAMLGIIRQPVYTTHPESMPAARR